MACQRGLAVRARLKVGDVRQSQRQAALGQGLPAALVAVHHGDGLAPVTLTAEHPVAQLVVDLIAALAVFFQPCDHLLFGIDHGQAVQEAGVDQRTGSNIGKGSLVQIGRGVALDHLDDGQAELLGEFPVAGIVGRHGHDGAGAVGGQNVVGDEDGDLGLVDRVDAHHTVQLHAGLFLVQLAALKVALAGSFGLISLDGIGVLDNALFQPCLEQGVLRGDDHVGSTEQGIAAGGVHGQGVPCSGAEVHLGAMAAADPVALLGLDTVDVIHLVQVIDQAVCVSGDLQHPLALHALHNGAAAALAHAVYNFLVGQNDLAAGAVVDGGSLFISQTVLVQLQEDPLGPLVVLGVGGVDLAVPVKAQAQCLQLALEAGHVLGGHDFRVDVVFQGIVLGRQTKSIPAHRVQDIIAALTLFACHNIQRGIAAGVANMQAGRRRVREFYQCIELGFGMVDLSMEGVFILPYLLPFGLNGLEIIFHKASLPTEICAYCAFVLRIGSPGGEFRRSR